MYGVVLLLVYAVVSQTDDAVSQEKECVGVLLLVYAVVMVLLLLLYDVALRTDAAVQETEMNLVNIGISQKIETDLKWHLVI